MLVAKALSRKGVKVLFDRKTVAVTGAERATGLAFADGSTLSADLIVLRRRCAPNADLAKAAGLAVGRGVIVDDHLAASLPGFHAIGECAEHRGIAYGLVEPAQAQAEVLARRLTGMDAAFTGMRLATNLKVSGLPVFSAGDFQEGEGRDAAVLDDRHSGRYPQARIRGAAARGLRHGRRRRRRALVPRAHPQRRRQSAGAAAADPWPAFAEPALAGAMAQAA